MTAKVNTFFLICSFIFFSTLNGANISGNQFPNNYFYELLNRGNENEIKNFLSQQNMDGYLTLITLYITQPFHPQSDHTRTKVLNEAIEWVWVNNGAHQLVNLYNEHKNKPTNNLSSFGHKLYKLQTVDEVIQQLNQLGFSRENISYIKNSDSPLVDFCTIFVRDFMEKTYAENLKPILEKLIAMSDGHECAVALMNLALAGPWISAKLGSDEAQCLVHRDALRRAMIKTIGDASAARLQRAY